jgi:hypothetical protein
LQDYFVTDKAKLFAPILSVEVTNFDDQTVFLIQDGNVTLEGFENVTLTGGKDYLVTLETVYGYTPPSAGTIVIPTEVSGFIAPE